MNQYLWKETFKYEDLHVVMMLFSQGELMFNFDLKSGYHHIEIVEHHRDYLEFCWNKVYYRFTVLPFRLASAPYAFTKLMRPIVRYWRAKGLKAVLYLDDDICSIRGMQETCKASIWVRDTLNRTGLVVNEAKSMWQPSGTAQWLGFVINLDQMCISVPDRKIAVLKDSLQAVLDAKWVEARCLASLVGKIIAMGLALGSVTRFMTRGMYALLMSRLAWCSRLGLSAEVVTEMNLGRAHARIQCTTFLA